MAGHSAVSAVQLRADLLAVADWLADGSLPTPGRTQLAAAVRSSARMLAQTAPGSSVEVRVPPYVAVQCISGPRHTRGTPPNVVETDSRTWLLLVIGRLEFGAALDDAALTASGSRAGEVAHWLPLLRM